MLATETLIDDSLETFIEETFKEIKIEEYYKKKEQEFEQELSAESLGFLSDNYYSAKDKMFFQNRLGMHMTSGNTGSFV